jgi:hypothetical protein
MADDQKDYQDYLDYQNYLTSVNKQPSPISEQDIMSGKAGEKIMNNVPMGIPVPLTPAQQGLTGGVLPNVSSLLGRIGNSTAVGALQGGAETMGGDLQKRTEGLGIGALTGAITGAVGEAAQGVAPWLMEKAANIKDKGKGFGQRLLDMGVWGTRSGIGKQAQQLMPEQEALVQLGIGKLSGEVPPEGIAQDIMSTAKKFIPNEGPIPSENIKNVALAEARAQEAISRGAMKPEMALSQSRAIAAPAYNMQEPLEAFKHKLSQAESSSIKNTLKSMGASQNVPQVSEGLANEQALYKAISGANTPETTAELVARYGLGALKGAALGTTMGHPGLAAMGAIASSPLGQSLNAQALSKVGKASSSGALNPILEALARSQDGNK